MTTLYRVICEAEFTHLTRVRRFAAGPNALESKWFALSIADALAWGKWFHEQTGIGHPYVVAIDIDLDASPPELALEKMDGIGPAVCLTLAQLKGIAWRLVHPDPSSHS